MLFRSSAGWMYKAGVESILGFYKQGEKLILDPSIPEKWKEYSISYKYMQTRYNIKVSNPNGISKGVRQVYVDGVIQAENSISLVNDGLIHQAEVLM